MSGIFDQFLREQARWRELMESPASMERLIREQKKLRQITEPIGEQLARESARLKELVDSPLERLLRETWLGPSRFAYERDVPAAFRAVSERLAYELDLPAFRAVSERFAYELDVPAFRAVSEANLSVLRMSEPDYISRYSQSLVMDQAWRMNQLSIPDLSPTIADHISRVSEFSALAELRLGQVEWDRLGARWNFNAPEIEMLKDRSTEMAVRYAGLFEQLSDRLTEFPPVVSAQPPVELLRAADVLVITSSGAAAPREVEEINSASALSTRGLLDESLAAFGADLLKMLHGARSALNANNPDRTRHVSASLRELATQILHRLAPDDEVKAWATKPEHLDNGRPTRRGRLAYIARQIDSNPFSEFLDADFRAAVKLFEVLQGGTHNPSSELTDDQLCALITRAEALMYFLLRLPN